MKLFNWKKNYTENNYCFKEKKNVILKIADNYMNRE
jgi:hypothetical protein